MLGLALIFVMAASTSNSASFLAFIVLVMFCGYQAYKAFKQSLSKRYIHPKFYSQWQMCEERRVRFHQAHDQLKSKGFLHLNELPGTVDNLAKELYTALRRADLTLDEVITSEGALHHYPTAGNQYIPDRQAQELYKLADKNIAEYQSHYRNVMASIERTEAQGAVFSTTLDALRIRMLNYRLAGKPVDVHSEEFMSAVIEAKMQFAAIDQALDEIALTPFPTTITIIPDIHPDAKVVSAAVESVIHPGFPLKTPPPAPPAALADETREEV